MALAVALLAFLGFTGANILAVSNGVEDRRRIATEQRVAQSEADLRLCEVAINMSRSDFRALVRELSTIQAPPANEAEAERRAAQARIIEERYAPVDCEAFVAKGVLRRSP